MKKNIFKTLLPGFVAMTAISALTTSCDDFLTITPTNSIVEEDFWEDKSELNNVVNACYRRLIDGDVMERFMIWGEARSDNFSKTTGTSWNNMLNLQNANLIPTNYMFNWQCFYNEINYCNKILKHGPQLVETDESFSEGDWLPIKAEATALRAFSHFVLVRTFGEVPYVTAEYNNDGQNLLLPQSTQQQVLDSIILDLEAVKDNAMEDYGNTVDNKGRVTKKMIYTLLADVYLWRASKNASAYSVAVYGNMSQQDYLKCIECCDYVINEMKNDRVKSLNKSGAVLGGVTEELTLEDLLIPNEASPTAKYSTYVGAYNYIFGAGNSMESIFELQFDGTNNSNSIVSGVYWNFSDNVSGSMVCSDALFSSVNTTPNDLAPSAVYAKTDYRKWENSRYLSASQAEYPINKYVNSSIDQSATSSSSSLIDNTNVKPTNQTRNTPVDANWIIYRLSDVMLMKAEAMSQAYSDEANLKTAFQLVRDIYKRSNPYAYSTTNKNAGTDSLKYETFASQEGIEALVMAERQREFFAEGKRWFDLVRYAQRKASTALMIKNFLGRKYSTNSGAVAAKLATIESLFSPVYINEIRNNPLLHQNSVWKTNDSSSKTDEL
jgi:hypothetical protein